MKCEKCGKNEATTYYKETINGQTRELHLCSDCAQALHLGAGFQNAFAGMQSFFSDPFDTFFGSGFTPLLSNMVQGNPLAGTLLGTERKCPACGMTESELRRNGRAGCPDCYHAFEDILAPYIREVQGADRHIGTAPTEQNPKEDLKARLQEAISQENYEEAARLRDEIRRLESDNK